MEMSIKAESIDIKSEDEEGSDSLLQSSDSGSFEKSDFRDAEEDGCKHENRATNECNTKVKQDDKVFYKCDKCIYETRSESRFIAHRGRHENDSEAYKCESCEYETENKKFFQKHRLRHKDSSETRMHRYGSCNYKTKSRCELAKHQVKHKSASEGRLYECDICDFKTKRKFSFDSHYIKHKNSNNRVECDYKTKYTALPNKNSLQLPIYKYDGCTYESKNKKNFTRHQLVHKDPSQVKMYKCNNCDYKTINKKCLEQHQLKHKDPSQVQMYKCNDCDYETKYKGVMKQHQLRHKDLSQIQMYRCNDCDFKTKYKSCIKRHQLKHKDPSQVQMYKCNDCAFETRFKRYIKHLCFKTVTVEGFEVIDNVIRDTLDVLLLKLKFDSEGKEVICNVCRRKLNAAFEFKATCLKNDYTIIPYVDCEKMLQLDIRDVYTKEKTNESMDISDSRRICRLCMEPVESEFRCICKEELEAIEKLAPEMNINIIKDPVVCKECFDSVCTHNSFLKNCLEVQEKIGGIFNSAATESRIDTSPADLFIKTENQDIEFDINGMEISIKAESVDIKSEDEEISDSLLQSSDSESFEKTVLRDAEEDGCKHENKSTNKSNTKVKQDERVFYTCDKCIYQTESEGRFIAHRVRHENDSEAYRCESYGAIYLEKWEDVMIRNRETRQGARTHTGKLT
ncbi:zinc finger protein 366-like [Anoplophora glabripennis]|uniref:zinc finger protein 366-like n=1 Tax=Anoplophora glabripennis TaxID=217634 RepID=UPI000C7901CE|nr:zinc finger protein 366-like [Anoplophora glabripennis]